jgi:2-alkyl-3-oxoalkanoate reductase
MNKTMRVAIIGSGEFSKEHISALQELDAVEVVGICDQDVTRAEALVKITIGAHAYQELGELLRQEKPNVVHILTPPATHAKLAIQVMEAGCHVLVEKPMALTVADADMMIEAARANGVMLTTDHNYLFNPCILKARQLVRQGSVGQVLHVNGFYGMPGAADDYRGVAGRSHWAWRLPGAAFTNFYPHMIYLAEAFISGDLSVSGVTLGREGGMESLPTELAVLLNGENASATLVISMRIQPYAKYIDIYGTKGIIHADLANEVCTFHKVLRAPGMISKVFYNLEESFQLATNTIINTAKVLLGLIKRNPGLRNHLKEFYGALQNGADLPVGGEDGRKMIKIMEETWEKLPESVSNPNTVSKIIRVINPETETEKKLAEKVNFGKVLVTGATGNLGYFLIKALARSGVDVRVLVRDPNRVSREIETLVEVVCGDIRDLSSLESAMRGVSVVYHCAAATRNYFPLKVHIDTNVNGTENVLKSALSAGVKRVIHISSVIVYGLSNGKVNEDSPYPTVKDPYANYMRTKIDADKLAIKYYKDFGLPVTVLRLGGLYGSSTWRSINKGLIQVGFLKFAIGSGRNHNPNTYIRNAVDCILLASISPQAIGQIYNVVDEPQLTGYEFSKRCEKVAGEKSLRISIPAFLMLLGAQFLEWRANRKGGLVPPRLSKFVVRSECRDIYYSTLKIREQLGWQPPISMDEGLREIYKA